MKTSVAVIILLVCLSGMIMNQTEGKKITCKWGGCPVNLACGLCCEHFRPGCNGGTCKGLLDLRCECDCPSG